MFHYELERGLHRSVYPSTFSPAHHQCPCRFFMPTRKRYECKLCGHKTTRPNVIYFSEQSNVIYEFVQYGCACVHTPCWITTLIIRVLARMPVDSITRWPLMRCTTFDVMFAAGVLLLYRRYEYCCCCSMIPQSTPVQLPVTLAIRE